MLPTVASFFEVFSASFFLLFALLNRAQQPAKEQATHEPNRVLHNPTKRSRHTERCASKHAPNQPQNSRKHSRKHTGLNR